MEQLPAEQAGILAQPLAVLDRFLEPVVPLAADLTLESFWQEICQISQAHWVVVDRDGRCLGRLNVQHLLFSLAQQFSLTKVSHSIGGRAALVGRAEVSQEVLPTTTLAAQQGIGLAAIQHDRGEDWVDKQEEPLETVAVSVLRSERGVTGDVLGLLHQLLDCLPIPIMVQTTEGVALLRNRAWSQQGWELVDGIALGRKMTAFVKSQIPSPPALQGAETLSTEETLFCEMEPHTQYWVCTASERGGTGQVLQFSGRPLRGLGEEDLGGTGRMGASSLVWEQIDSQEWEHFCLAPLIDGGDAEGGTVFDPGDSSSLGGRTLWLIWLENLTEQCQTQQELAAMTTALTQMTHLKGEFLAALSHEMKTPLTAVLGLSNLLQRKELGELNCRQADYAHLIHQSSRQLMHLLNCIVDLTRLEAGELELFPEDVAIAPVVERAREQVRILNHLGGGGEFGREEGLRFALEVEVEKGLATVVADPLRLGQMLVHLLLNAVKFTEEGGRVGLQIQQRGDWVEWTVWDRGSGIPDDQQHLVFQQLFQPLQGLGEGAGRTGAGLGLMLTRQLAKLHGGEVSFCSQVGKGSRFTLVLPTGGGTPGRWRSQLGTPSPWVLVVAQGPELIEQLTDSLAGLGYGAIVARSVPEALEKVNHLPVAAILFCPDLIPTLGWNSVSLFRKASRSSGRIPFVAIAPKSEWNQGRQRGVEQFLSFPFDSEALAAYLPGYQQVAEESYAYPLTILCLVSEGGLQGQQGEDRLERSAPSGEPLNEIREAGNLRDEDHLGQLLHHHHHRIVEADDLEQAEVLARVWQPHLMVLDCRWTNPVTSIQELANHEVLTSMPVVVLGRAIAWSEQEGPERIFPCTVRPDGEINAGEFLQTIQRAARSISSRKG